MKCFMFLSLSTTDAREMFYVSLTKYHRRPWIALCFTMYHAIIEENQLEWQSPPQIPHGLIWNITRASAWLPEPWHGLKDALPFVMTHKQNIHTKLHATNVICSRNIAFFTVLSSDVKESTTLEAVTGLSCWKYQTWPEGVSRHCTYNAR